MPKSYNQILSTRLFLPKCDWWRAGQGGGGGVLLISLPVWTELCFVFFCASVEAELKHGDDLLTPKHICGPAAL